MRKEEDRGIGKRELKEIEGTECRPKTAVKFLYFLCLKALKNMSLLKGKQEKKLLNTFSKGLRGKGMKREPS